MNWHSFTAIVFVLLVASAQAQTPTVVSALQDIESTYDFDPSAFTFAEQAKRSPTLSALWDRYDKAPGVYREALRGALLASGKRELLYCDGGMLLLAKSKASEDLNLGLQSIAKCSLSEIEHTPYFRTMHSLALRGVDALDLQFRILDRPSFQAYIPAHALTLGQNYAFTYPLLVQEESRYVPRVIDRLRAEKYETAGQTLVLALWYAATAPAEAGIRAIINDSQYPHGVREFSAKAIERTVQFRSMATSDARLTQLRAQLRLGTNVGEAELRAKRRARMRSISDEALIELDAYTPLIYRTFK
jgi:hypothetical protein